MFLSSGDRADLFQSENPALGYILSPEKHLRAVDCASELAIRDSG